MPLGDGVTRDAHVRCGGVVADEVPNRPAPGVRETALDRLRTSLFASEPPPAGDVDDTVHVFSAPGEGREAVEIVRRVLQEAARGVPFDEMAVLLRAPQTYLGLLEHAFARAGIPAWFERGTRRPDPAGRAFLALLACADESLSARRFAEYLSLAQVPPGVWPQWHESGATVADPDRRRSSGHRCPRTLRPEDPAPIDEAPPASERDPDDRVVAGTLRAPWRWEELLVEAYVIEGLDRWQRRLPGLRAEYERRLKELADEDQDSPRLLALARDRDELRHLESFALPIVAELDSWDSARNWGAWLTAFEALVPRVLRQPARVLRVLAEMAPLGSVGPVTLREVREVLAQRLLTTTHEPPRRRHGQVLVGTPQAARGRTFRVVFVPGLAERIFPQRLREDALLLDARRADLGAPLAVADTRADDERLQLRLAVGAAAERIHLSYPRLELAESRPRVPSFYVLDVLRATTGRIPRYKALSDLAFENGRASLDWPAPPSPEDAIDDLEHDLAVLRPLLREPASERSRANGRARYLLELNPSLLRSMRERYARWQQASHPADGLNRVVDLTRPALDQARLTARPYSLTALQRFAVCPYQFQLAAIYRLAPLEEPAPLQRLDPLTKGSLFHEIQTECLRRLQANGMLPVTAARLPAARQMLEWAIGTVTAKAKDDLVPAIERVWKDEIAALRVDLQGWLEGLVRDSAQWTPERFELAFGLPDDPNRDPASTAAAGRRGRAGVPAARLDRPRGAARRRQGAARHRPQDREEPHQHRHDRRGRPGAPAGALRGGARGHHRRAGGGGAAVVLHGGRRLQPSTRSRSTRSSAPRPRSARDRRSGDRARHAGGAAGTDGRPQRLRVLRLPAGLRPRRGAPGQAQAECSPTWTRCGGSRDPAPGRRRRPPADCRGARRYAGRRSRGRHRQDHRAGQAHRPADRDRPRHDSRDRRRHLLREGRR